MNATDDARARQARPRTRFTVLLPVLRGPEMLPFAIRSVLAQSFADFELCVICDGAPPETAQMAEDFAASDPRVRVFAFPKGLRHGEAHRAAVLAGAQSDFVAHIGDDDLWLHDHLKTLSGLLAKADFVSVPGFWIEPDGLLRIGNFGDLTQIVYRLRLLQRKWNFFGPTEAAYRLDAYRRLPDGWSPGRKDVWSDLNMWRKFLADPSVRACSGQEISTLKFPTPYWQHLLPADRAKANAAAWQRVQDHSVLAELRVQARWLLAQSITWRGLAALLVTNPARYGPLLRLKLSPRPGDDLRLCKESDPQLDVAGQKDRA